MDRPLLASLGAVALLVGACGGRTGLESGSAGLEPSAEAGEASTGSDGSLGSPRGFPGDSSSPGFPGDSGSGAPGCTPQPAEGRVVASFNGDIGDLAVRGSTLFLGTSDTHYPKPHGTIDEVPVGGGAKRSVVRSGYILGGFTFDTSRIYYPSSTVHAKLISQTGLVAEDLVTGAIQELPAPLRFANFAASPARAGLYWSGGPTPSGAATTLYYWDPESDTNVLFATGVDLAGIAVDESSVYWADTGGGQVTVYAAPLTGGSPSTLATVPWHVTRGGLLGVSSTSVVFASDYAVGSVEAVNKAGGPVRHVVTSPFVVAAVDDESFYWSDYSHQGRLERTPLAGGTTEQIWDQRGDGYVETLAFDACNVYIGLANVGQVYARTK